MDTWSSKAKYQLTKNGVYLYSLSSLKELVDCADFAGEQKTNLKTYVQERKNNFKVTCRSKVNNHDGEIIGLSIHENFELNKKRKKR